MKTWIHKLVNKHPCQCKPAHLGCIPQPDSIKNRFSGETNIESIRALEEQIIEHERVVNELKRTRNSLLNVSKFPPEVLGDIFRWNVSFKKRFDGLEEGSRNFLLVCHHWFEVALHTPEVWSFWGNTPADWTRWHRRSGTAPLDLVLCDGGHDDSTLNVTLRDALRDRAVRDVIRRVHLWSRSAALLSSTISPLIVARGGVRVNGVESFIVVNNSGTPLPDISDFFTYHHFPKLRRLELYNCRIVSWDLLASRTGVLTTLILHLTYLPSTPTTSQLLSILASNPTLQKVSLSESVVPDDGGGKSPFRVPLHHLTELELHGGLQHVIGLLHRLGHPTNMDKLDINVCDCALTDILQIIGPYLQDYLRRRGRSQNGLGLFISRYGLSITFQTGDIGAINPSTSAWRQVAKFIEITMKLDEIYPDSLGEGVLDLIAHCPRNEIVCFCSWSGPAAMQDISAQLPNLRVLHFGGMFLSHIFQEPNLDDSENGELFPSLQHIFAEHVFVGRDGWSPLMTFLAHRSSSGNPLRSFTVVDSYHMCVLEEERIRGVVQEFRFNRLDKHCPFYHEYCQERELLD